jgi:CRP-like cAMP-binding protein
MHTKRMSPVESQPPLLAVPPQGGACGYCDAPQHAGHEHPGAHKALDRAAAAWAQPAAPDPARNQLLAALPAELWQQLRPHMTWVEMRLGAVLHDSGALLSHVYFPSTAIVSLVSMMRDGASAESAVVGNEGLVGVCAIMGGGMSLSSAVVQSAGHGVRMSAKALDEAARRSPALMQTLLGYTQALLTQMAQTAACNRHHALDQQLCRWLLINHDRGNGNELVATQERIANLLGVRREGVTAGAMKLQNAGLIHYARGRITILDRAGLEQRSCECYGVIRKAYDRLRENTLGTAAPRLVPASRAAANASLCLSE